MRNFLILVGVGVALERLYGIEVVHALVVGAVMLVITFGIMVEEGSYHD